MHAFSTHVLRVSVVVCLLSVLVLFPVKVSGIAIDSDTSTPSYHPQRVIIALDNVIKPAANSGAITPTATQLDRLGKQFGVTEVKPIGSNEIGIQPTTTRTRVLPGVYLINYTANIDSKLVAEAYERLRSVRYAEPDYIMHALRTDPNDTYWSTTGSWGQAYRDQWDMEIISCPTAWDISTGSSDVIVAVSDTGVDYSHPDIQANMWTNDDEIPGNLIDDDGNGYVDDYYGYDFAYGDSDPMDGDGHGTHCAGTIGAVGNNGIGIAGVNWTCKIMAVKGLSDFGSGYGSDLAQGIVYATDNGAKVISMSWGGGSFVNVIHDALEYAHENGVILSAAAGNDDENVSGTSSDNYTDIAYPANDNYVITVAASDELDNKVYFSNWGIKIAVSAPGGSNDFYYTDDGDFNILSLLSSESWYPYYFPHWVVGTEYLRLAGTSMACPHVSGLAALILSVHPEWTNEQVRQAIQMNADDVLSQGFDRYTGYGRINAYNSITCSEPLTALITYPLCSASIDGEIEFKGTADGPNFLSWELAYGEGYEPTEWTTIATGQSPVINDTLSTATISANEGMYTLCLRTIGTGDFSHAEYRIQVQLSECPPAANPVMLPRSGNYNRAQYVTITSPTRYNTIYYTLDGSEPTENSSEYISPVLVDHGLTLKAKTWASGFSPSGITTETYTFTMPKPSFNPRGGVITSPVTVYMFSEIPNATIHYTTDGTNPTENSTAVTSGSSIVIDSPTTLKAIASNSGWTSSDIQTATFETHSAGNIYVDADASGPTHDGASWATAYTSIQDAMDVAGSGDQVWVAAGTYNECIWLPSGIALYGGFDGTETLLSQRDWETNTTVIDGNLTGTVVTIVPSATSSTRIDGFTIQNGASPRGGGGIYCYYNCSPTIANNVITSNVTTYGAGGIYCQYMSSPTISNNTITNNTATQGGGGIGLYYACAPTITDNVISSNTASNGGGGIACYYSRADSAQPVISDNTISSNTAYQGGGIACYSAYPTISGNTITGNKAKTSSGGGIYCYRSTASLTINTVISGNTITGNISNFGGAGIACDHSSSPDILMNLIKSNSASADGGGIMCRYSSSPTIANNVISSNSAILTGGGIYCRYYSSPNIINNTLYSNSAGNGGGICCSLYSAPIIGNNIVAYGTSGLMCDATRPTLKNNCLYGNTAYDYYGMDMGYTDILSNPLFVDITSQDLHLQATSPCKDAGDDSLVDLSWLDMDGLTRTEGEKVDIGAFEYR